MRTAPAPSAAPGGLLMLVPVLAGCAGADLDARRSDVPALTVAPFETMEGAARPESRFFAEGLRADLLQLLSRVDGLVVVPWQTSGGAAPLEAPAGPPVRLEGSLERTVDRFRAEVRLVDAASGEAVWAETFDRALSLDNVFQIQQEIAQEVTRALAVALSADLVSEMGVRPTGSLAAYDRYLEGRDSYARRFTVSEAINAVRQFQAAQRLDSAFAAAYAAEAEARVWLHWYAGQREQADSARLALDRALALNPGAVETRSALASYVYRIDRDFAEARRMLEGLQEDVPGSSDVQSMLGGIARREGRWDAAVQHFQRAAQLDPDRVGAAVTMAQTLRYLRRYDASLDWADRAVALDSADTRARAERTWTLIGGRGDTAAARRGLEGLDADQSVRARARTVLLSPPADPAFYRRDFPAAVALWETTGSRLSIMMVSWLAGDAERARATADSVAATPFPPAAAPPNVRASAILYRAMAGAIHGRRARAHALADSAVALLPPEADAFAGPRIQMMRALVSIAAGDVDAAFRQLEAVAELPSELGPGQLRLNPWFDTLRDDPRFDALYARVEAPVF